MSIETSIVSALTGLVAGRVFADVGIAGTAKPYITYQQVGGTSVNFVDAAAPSKANGRFQINVWGDTRSSVAVLAAQAEAALRSVLQATVLGQPVASYEPDTLLRGSRQDFSFWI